MAVRKPAAKAPAKAPARKATTRKTPAKPAAKAPAKTYLPDGRECINRRQTAELLGISRQALNNMVRDGKIPEIEGTKMLALEDIMAIKAQREGKATSKRGQPEEVSSATKLASAQLNRVTTNVLKFGARLHDAQRAHLISEQTNAAIAEILTLLDDNLAAWTPTFTDHLTTSQGQKVFAREIEELNREAKRTLGHLAPLPKIKLPKDELTILDIAELPQHFDKVVDARAALEIVKTQTDLIDYKARIGHLVERESLNYALENAGVTLKTRIANMRGKLLPHLSKQAQALVRQDLADLNTALVERFKDAALLEGVAEPFLRGFEPVPYLSVSEWAAEHRVLSNISSAEAGRWSNERTPYLVEPMDVCGNDETRRVTLCFASQLGKSELVLNVLGHTIDMNPSPIMLMQPTVDMAEAFSKDRITPLLQGSPQLARKVEEAGQNQKGGAVQKALSKSFAGGTLALVGASSPSQLASRPIAKLLCDEVSRYPLSAGEEGNPISIAERRTASFPHTKKIIIVSTPTTLGSCEVTKHFERGTKEYFFAVCPHCSYAQTLEFEQIHFDPDRPEDAAYQCAGENCGTLWDDAQRQEAISMGHWQATAPDAGPEHRSFHLNGLYSPFYSLGELTNDMVRMKGNPAEWRSFVNTVQALPYTEAENTVEVSSLINRVESFSLDDIPVDVLSITVGVDVQANRLEAQYLGHSECGQTFVLGYDIIAGDTSIPHGRVWAQLSERTNRNFKHPYGGEITIDAIAVDSGFNTNNVQQWCQEQPSKRYAIKGVSSEQAPIWKLSESRRTKGKGAGYLLHLIGTNQAKSTVMAMLQKPQGEQGSVRIGYLDGITADDYAEQMVSEQRQVTFRKNGTTSVEWIKTAGVRNEALDTAIYGLAVFQGTQRPDWEERAAQLQIHNHDDEDDGWVTY